MHAMTGLAGHTLIVTGAGGGLGRAYARSLAAAGAQVVVNDLGGARDGSGAGTAMADGVVDEIRAEGGQAVASYADISSEAGATELVQTALDAFGGLHGVVNNAGILRDASFAKMTSAEWEAVLRVHQFGSFHVTRAAWGHLREQGYGRIVMATSTSGLYGSFGQANYASAKAGLVGLALTLAIEGARSNIGVNCVAPLAATRMTADVAPQEVLDRLDPEFVPPVVTHLMSEECTDSGQIFVVGGGLVQRHSLFMNKGVTFADVPTVAEVRDRWAEITDQEAMVPGVNPVG